MAATFRESQFGQLVRFVTGNRVLQYPEETPDFRLPECWQKMLDGHAMRDGTTAQGLGSSYDEKLPERKDTAADKLSSSSASQNGQGDEENQINPDGLSALSSAARTRSRGETIAYTNGRYDVDQEHELEKTRSVPIVPKTTKDGAILVDWYYTDDPANPQNWSGMRRGLVSLLICVYTFVVYTSSAIYTTSEQGVMAEFNVDEIEASLGLALFVFGYGLGPLAFSPLSEIPRIGRNPIYIYTMFLFVILSIPTALPHNYAGLMILRFLQGLFGSPCLANGAASFGDMYSMKMLPYMLTAWVSAAYCGPALGPLLSGFSVPVMGWRWSLLEILWASSPVFVVMFLFLPETSTSTLLLQRAERLRKLTGSTRFMSQSEIDQRNLNKKEVLINALIKPLEITILDPAILFVQIYSSIIYGIYYSFFEVFPLVYPVYYGMSVGEMGLVFVCLLVSCLIAVVAYTSYLYFCVDPHVEVHGFPIQESRLVPAMIASFGPTIGLLVFAWTASPNIHWIVPTIGITIYGAAAFVVMQCIFVYVPLSYPQYAASLFAGNDFFRSSAAFAAILFSGPLFARLGVARGTSLLAGLSVIGIIGIFLLYRYGAKLRSMSKFAI